jgi:hypothetical protein
MSSGYSVSQGQKGLLSVLIYGIVRLQYSFQGKTPAKDEVENILSSPHFNLSGDTDARPHKISSPLPSLQDFVGSAFGNAQSSVQEAAPVLSNIHVPARIKSLVHSVVRTIESSARAHGKTPHYMTVVYLLPMALIALYSIGKQQRSDAAKSIALQLRSDVAVIVRNRNAHPAGVQVSRMGDTEEYGAEAAKRDLAFAYAQAAENVALLFDDSLSCILFAALWMFSKFERPSSSPWRGVSRHAWEKCRDLSGVLYANASDHGNSLGYDMMEEDAIGIAHDAESLAVRVFQACCNSASDTGAEYSHCLSALPSAALNRAETRRQHNSHIPLVPEFVEKLIPTSRRGHYYHAFSGERVHEPPSW